MDKKLTATELKHKDDMKKFLRRSTFFGLLFTLLMSTGFMYRDATPGLLNALTDKHQLLETAQSPKIILLGGSNVSFGINSHLLHEHYNMPVINTGIFAEIGLKYMLSDVRRFINKSDIVILLPEYVNYHSDFYYGSRGLVSLLFDVYPEGLKHISLRHWTYLAPHMVNYAAVKVSKLPDYLKEQIFGKKEKKSIGIYDRNSFNEFGDAYIHWTMEPQPIPPAAPIPPGSVTINQQVLDDIEEFKEFVNSKGATLTIFPPCLQEDAYHGGKWIIDEIAARLQEYNFKPERYIFPDELCFDSVYHLVKEGVDIRTQRLIEDLDQYLKAINYQ